MERQTRWSDMNRKKKGNRSMEEKTEVPDSANLLQDPEALKKLLMAQVRAGGGSQALDAKAHWFRIW